MVFEVKVGATSTCGTTSFDAEDAAELPAEFVAFTVKVYEVPCVKPVTGISPDAAPASTPVILPGCDVAV
jgi:hypothetical protein